MPKIDVNIKKLNEKAIIPTYGTECSAGFDLYSVSDEEITINPHETVFIKTGLAMEIPIGYGGFIFARSGLSTKKGLAPVNKVGIIDADYRGEIMVALYNQTDETKTIDAHERIAQMVIMPFITANFIETNELSETKRGNNGFGSSGK